MQTNPVAEHPPNSTALIEGERSVSYGELAQLIAKTAGGLRTAGVSKGDRVALVSPNDVAFVTGFLAIQSIGAVACPIGYQNPEAVVQERLRELAPVAMVVSPAAANVASWVEDSGLLEPDRIGTPAGSQSADVRSMDRGEPLAPIALNGSDAAVILHTSGIVGAPRAAVLSAQSLVAAQERIAAVTPALTSSHVALGALPFTHVLGLNMCLLPSLRVGSTVVLQPRWQSAEALELMVRHGVTTVVAVPPMWSGWARLAGDDTSLRQATRSVVRARTGASTLNPTVAAEVFEVFGLELAQGYGLTETAGTVTYEPTARPHPGSVGRPLPDVELKLVEDGREVEPGDRGEVWIRTGSIFEGYLGDAPATAEVLISNGWLRTGDIAIQDDDGTLYLAGRSKDLINVSGFNVFPAEVEEVLETHPSVHGAVVVGETNDASGERVVAYITSAVGDPDLDAIIDHCRENLSRYKVPATVHLVDRLPLTASGKRVRKELR